MADARIEIKVGSVSFSGEGESKWVAEQLDKMLEKLPVLANAAPQSSAGATAGDTRTHSKAAGPLAAFIVAKNAKTNKTRKFLAAALWIQDSKGLNRLATSDVTKALSENNQGSVGNASQRLNDNVRRGLCIKEGRQFYVSDEGRSELG